MMVRIFPEWPEWLVWRKIHRDIVNTDRSCIGPVTDMIPFFWRNRFSPDALVDFSNKNSQA